MESAPELVSFVERMFRNWNALDADAFVDTFSGQPGSSGRKTESTDIIIVARRVRSIELRGCTDQSRPVFGNIQGNLDQRGQRS